MKMQKFSFNEYFDFFNDDDIRIKGTRVGIETVLDDYLNATSPEEIAVRYPVLTLEQVYATITFYLRNQNEIDLYIHRWREYAEKAWLQQKQNPSPAIQRLIKLKSQRSQ
ncbi:protein containing DUF433 [Candidatus Magnetomorum sp. HK-1]|nr:protein containing DUF433 [Candidatus Magnetomorum sp. HK-1]